MIRKDTILLSDNLNRAYLSKTATGIQSMAGSILVTGNIYLGDDTAINTNYKFFIKGNVGFEGKLDINQGSTNNLALELRSSGFGWGSGLRLTNTTAITGRTYGIYSGSEGALHVTDVTGDADRIFLKGTGELGIGTATPTEKLHVAGKILADTSVKIASKYEISYNAGEQALDFFFIP